MTPEYASPEQVRGRPISTSSDVYQLGLLLYQLLCGFHPHRTEERTALAFDRVVCEQEPPAPSLAVAGRGVLPPATSIVGVANGRRLSPDKLRRTLAGDLDTIVLMALRKEPERRYPSAEQLDQDIERYLLGHPVVARKDTIAYRTRKLVFRHRLSVGFTAALLILAAASGWHLAKERNRASRAARDAAEIASFTRELLEASDPGRTKGDEISARELLNWGATQLALERNTSPEVRATIMTTLGDIYRRRGMYEQARGLLEKALSLQPKPSEDQTGLAATLNALADLARAQGRYPESEPLYLKALEVRERALGETHPDVAATLDNLGDLQSLRGRYSEAKAFFRRALQIRMATLGVDHPDVGGTLANLAVMSMESGECETSLRQFRRALAIAERALGPDHPQVAATLTRMAFVMRADGDWASAEAALRRALEIRERRLGDRHPDVFAALNNLGDHYQKIGAYREAEALYARALATGAVALPPEHPSFGVLYNNLCALRLDQGDPAGAAAYCARGLAIRKKALGRRHPAVPLSLRNLARLRVAQGRSEDAVKLQERMLDIYFQLDKPPGARTTLYDMGMALLALGRDGEAEAAFRESLQGTAFAHSQHGGSCYRSGLHEAKVHVGLGLVCRARGDEVAARGQWVQSFDLLESRQQPPTVEALDVRARVLLLLGRTRAARPLVARLDALGWRNPDLASLRAQPTKTR